MANDLQKLRERIDAVRARTVLLHACARQNKLAAAFHRGGFKGAAAEAIRIGDAYRTAAELLEKETE